MQFFKVEFILKLTFWNFQAIDSLSRKFCKKFTFLQFSFTLKHNYYRWAKRPAISEHKQIFCASNIEWIQTYFVLIHFFVNKYEHCFHNMPDKRRLVTSKVCFGSEKVGLLENSYNKCALANSFENTISWRHSSIGYWLILINW